MSLRITPAASHPSSTTNTQSSKLTPQTTTSRGAPSAPGLPDTLRLQQTSTSHLPSLTSAHPLESRLSQWTSTQSQLQNNLLRRNFGLALPLRLEMERNMVSRADGFRPSCLGAPSGVHSDVLRNRDTSIDWEDVYAGQDGLRSALATGGDGSGLSATDEMEVKVGMGKW